MEVKMQLSDSRFPSRLIHRNTPEIKLDLYVRHPYIIDHVAIVYFKT